MMGWHAMHDLLYYYNHILKGKVLDFFLIFSFYVYWCFSFGIQSHENGMTDCTIESMQDAIVRSLYFLMIRFPSQSKSLRVPSR